MTVKKGSRYSNTKYGLSSMEIGQEKSVATEKTRHDRALFNLRSACSAEKAKTGALFSIREGKGRIFYKRIECEKSESGLHEWTSDDIDPNFCKHCLYGS